MNCLAVVTDSIDDQYKNKDIQSYLRWNLNFQLCNQTRKSLQHYVQLSYLK